MTRQRAAHGCLLLLWLPDGVVPLSFEVTRHCCYCLSEQSTAARYCCARCYGCCLSERLVALMLLSGGVNGRCYYDQAE